MDRDKLLTELYNSRVMNEIRKEYRNTGKEIQNLRNKITELENLFRSEESYSLTVKEYFDKSDELNECKKQLNIIFNNEQYKSIFESILSDKYDESIANHSDVLSPDELIDELISRRNDKTRAATFKLVYTRMENYYDVKWDKMIRRYKRETGRINVLKKELLYWNRGLVERFRISIHDLLEIN